ncbi:outer membrane beta-barrel protein [Mucilaginibacter sp. SMC90]|uniref:outer membrane beta-barrel protein n=1 Tax=Mucilaginibacter sp. SMC90 TaxID=2929803 RepID=UPI001FB514BC|nr:outer membrane beta-barrel protein [Mucilaginibacter sp. SMC90]UOE48061.1 outer membrane beta-barrel protein [Mucilaginibacter sp. SMC90]
MDDQLDNDLRDRIREVFDNYEDTTADEGWLLLREKFPVQEKQRRPVYLWWASAAAALLLFLSIGLWIASNKNSINNNDQTLSVKPLKPAQPQTNTTDSVIQNAAPVQPPVTAGQPVATNATNLASNNSAQSPVTKPNPAGNAAVSNPNIFAGSTSLNKPANNSVLNQQPAITPAITPSIAGPVKTDPANTIAKTNAPVVNQAANNSALNTLPVKKADSVNTVLSQTNTQQFANTPAVQPPVNNNPAKTSPVNIIPSVVKVKPKANSMEALLASDHDQAKKPDMGADERRVKFSVYAATFFNYAKGSQNQVNAGAGFTSDIRLSKNFKLSTGLALAQNTLNYDKSQPTDARAAVSFSPALTAAYNNVDEFSKVSASPTFTNYNAKLVGLDIPVNLKYEFNPQKNDTYISAGVSSGTFINEAYTASYSYPSLALAAGVQPQTSDETTHKSFNSFYFAKTLNVAFGVGYPLGKTNKLIIEPFLKYPLDGLGSQQIKFGAGGLNLKLNFTTHKK